MKIIDPKQLYSWTFGKLWPQQGLNISDSSNKQNSTNSTVRVLLDFGLRLLEDNTYNKDEKEDDNSTENSVGSSLGLSLDNMVPNILMGVMALVVLLIVIGMILLC
jgi:hypothetical protein